MHLRYQHRDHRDRLDLGDRLEHQRLERRNLGHHLDVGYQNQHLLGEEHRLDVGHRPDEEHRPDLGERRLRHLDVEHHLDEDRGPCPGWS
jgi:hypothetical protein